MAFSADETCLRTVLTAPARWGTGIRCPRYQTRELGGHEVLRPRPAGSTLFIGLVLLAMAGMASAQPSDIPPTWGGSFWDGRG